MSRIFVDSLLIDSLNRLSVPVAAGMERDGRTPLYFACAWHEGLRCVGYSGPNTMGAHVPYGGEEVVVQDDYEVLVWRQGQAA